MDSSARPFAADIQQLIDDCYEQEKIVPTPEEIRTRLNDAVDAKRERLRRIDDAALAALVDHLRSLVPNEDFDPVSFLAEWLWGPVPALGGLTPAEMLERDGGLQRLKQNLSQQVSGVYV